MNATKEGNEELLSSGATIDLQEKFGRSALIIATKQNRNEMASWLLEKGAAVNLVQNDALMSANGDENIEIFAR